MNNKFISIQDANLVVLEIDKTAQKRIEGVRTKQAHEYMLMFASMLSRFDLKNHQIYVSRLGCYGCLAIRRKGKDTPLYKMRIEFIRAFSGESSSLRDVLRYIDSMLDESWVGSIENDVIFTGDRYVEN